MMNIHQSQPEADSALLPLTNGLDLKVEQDRASFRTRVMTAYRSAKLSAVNRLLHEPRRSNYEAQMQLAREFLIRRRREGVW